MTFSADAITDVVLDLSGETENYGQAAAETLKAALMQKQSNEIDTVSGATLTSKALIKAVDYALAASK